MRKLKHRAVLEKSLLATAAIFLLAGIIALGFLQTLSQENRALVVIATSLGTLLCLVGVMSTRAFWQWLRKRTWRRAMFAWTERSGAANTPQFGRAGQLPEAALRQLAVQIYSRMGYSIIHRDGEEDYIRLANPEGRIELVAYKKLPHPVEIGNIYGLQREMKKAEAVRGFFGAPEGFTSEAIHWARQRPIVLADGNEIGRLVDCARENGSTLLES